MDEIRNPFAPGAGSPPPELAGRESIIAEARIALQRVYQNRPAKHRILLGLRGVGKTVLLNEVRGLAEEYDHVVSFIEAPEDARLVSQLYPRLHQALRAFSMTESAKEAVHRSFRILRSFASVFKVKVGDVSIAVDPMKGVADSGNLEFDLSDLFVSVGEAAKSAGRAWTLFIDEVQYLKKRELAALITALHATNQKGLPVLFYGAGLPQIAGMSGEAKSYAERLFDFPKIDRLPADAAYEAIRIPIQDEGEAIEPEAIQKIVSITKGYPFFLQEWGFQCWNVTNESPIDVDDVDKATVEAFRRLDESFFAVRYDRLTPKEKEYVVAMATLGRGPYKSSDIANVLGVDLRTLGPTRSRIITKGMIYSPTYGDIDFTVPMFDDFLRRTKKP